MKPWERQWIASPAAPAAMKPWERTWTQPGALGRPAMDSPQGVQVDEAPGPDPMQAAIALSRPKNEGMTPVPATPFSGETQTDLLKRRGQQFVAGAADAAAAIPEGQAILDAGFDQSVKAQAPESVRKSVDSLRRIEETMTAGLSPISGKPLTDGERAELLRRADEEKTAIEAWRPIAESGVAAAGDRGGFKTGAEIRDWAAKIFGVPDPADQGLWGQVANGLGQMSVMAGASVLPGGVAIGAGIGAGMNAAAVYKEAIAAGADEQTALKAATLNGAVGLSEVVPLEGALKFLPAKLRGEVGNRLARYAGNVAEGAGTEAVQEGGSQVAQNVIAQNTYDPNRPTMEGVGQSAFVGGVTGGIVSGVASAPAMAKKAAEREQAAALAPIEDRLTRQRDEAKAADAPPQVMTQIEDRLNEVQAERERLESPIDTDLLRQGEAVLQAAEEGRLMPAPAVDQIDPAQAAVLFAAGYDAENITDMSPEERAAEVATAADQNVQGIDPGEAQRRIDEFRQKPAAEKPTAAGNTVKAGAAVPPAVASATVDPATDVVSLDPATIKSDPARFQFKSGGDAQGVTEQLTGVKEWSDEGSGIAVVWEDNKGERFIVDGHQRLGLAQRLQAQGQKPRLRAIILREKDGVSAEEAMQRGAIKNLQEGGESTSALDVAKVFRRGGTTEAVKAQIPPGRKAYKDGLALSRLSDEAFNLVINDRVPAAYAAEVGREIEGDAPQLAALDYLMKNPPANAAQARIIVGQMKAEGFATESQDSLFGSQEVATPLFSERARILDKASQHLRMLGKVFKTAIDSEGVLSEAGNVLNSEANSGALSENQKLALALEKLSQRKGPVSDALSAQARRLAAGEISVGKAREAFLEALRQPDAGASAPVVDVGGKPDRAGAEKPAGQVRTDAPKSVTTEQTPEGEQTVIPGAEKVEPAAAKKAVADDRAKAEMAVKAQQSKMRRGGQERVEDGDGLFGGAQEGMKFAKGRNTDTGVAKNLDERIDDVVAGKRRLEPIVIGTAPKVLTALGVPNDPLTTTPGVIDKAIAKHKMTVSEIKAALRGVYDPAMIFDSAPQSDGPEGSLVVAVHVMSGGRPVTLAVHLGKKIGRIAITDIASVNARKSSQIKLWMDQGLIRYVGGRAGSWLSLQGLQLPQAVVQSHRLGKKVLLSSDVFKPDVKQARARISPSPAFTAATDTLTRDLARIAPGVDLRVVNRLFAVDETGRFELSGLFDERGVITVSLANTGRTPGATLGHEAIHALKSAGLFKPDEWRALERAARADTARMQRAREEYPELDEAGQVEEVIADMFGDWRNDAKGFVRTAFEKIRNLLRALGSALRGNGFTTVESVFSRVESGAVGGRSVFDASNSSSIGFAASKARVGSLIVYHGSPHDFDRFSLDKIGTGEGAQAYGHGLYFAENEGVAKSYRDALSSAYRDVLSYAGPDRARNAASFLAAGVPEDDVIDALRSLDDTDPVASLAQGKQILSDAQKSGHMYEVQINADPADFLDWDAPLSAQPEKVRDAINRVGRSPDVGLDAVKDDMRANFYAPLTHNPAAVAELKRHGIPGIKYLDAGSRNAADGSRNYVVFDDSLIEIKRKYAKARSGVERIKAANEATGLPARQSDMGFEESPKPGSFPTPKRTAWMKFTENMHDSFEMLRAAQASIEKHRGAKLSESVDAYLATSLFETRRNDKIRRFWEQDAQPLLREIDKSGVDMEDLRVYLIAKHAPERNAVMAARDPKWATAPGSGVSDAAAAMLLADLDKEGKTAKLEAIAQKVRTIIKQDLNRRHAAGLISTEQKDAWAGMYQNYVPLRGWAERDDGENAQVGPIGKGFDIRGPESRKALGRMSQADHPLTQALAMAQDGLIRVEKNKVGKTLLRLAAENPNDDLFRVIGKLPMKVARDVRTGEEALIVDYGALERDRILSVKIGGKSTYIELSPELAHAMKNLGMRNAGAFFDVLRSLSRQFSRLLTGANPDFFIPNAQSDFFEGLLTAMGNKDVKGAARNFAINYKGAMSALSKNMLGIGANKEWSKWIDEWAEAGGRMEFMGYKELSEIESEMDRAVVRRGKWRIAKTAMHLPSETLQAIERLNAPFENAARLAMYVTARKAGVSKAKAAEMSLDVSGNYMKRGNYAPILGALYPFFNASVKGIEKFGRMANPYKHPKMAAFFATVPIVAMSAAMFLASEFPDDDDPEGIPLYFKIDPWERARAIIIPHGVEEVEITDPDGSVRKVKRLKYTPIRIPHNLRPLWVLGDKLAELRYGAIRPSAAAKEVFSAASMNFNPIGGDDLVSAVSPMVIDPLLELSRNKNSFGAPIRPEPFVGEAAGVNAFNYFPRGTAPAYVWMSQALNEATGGNSVKPGLIDIYPNQIEYLTEFLTGGLGRFVSRGFEAGRNLMDDVPTPPERVPVMRTFMGKTSDQDESRRFYDAFEVMNNKMAALRQAKKLYERGGANVDWADVEALAYELGVKVEPGKDIDAKVSWTKILTKASKAASEIRQDIYALQSSPEIPRGDRERQILQLQGQIEAVLRKAREDYTTARLQITMP